ncbi:hypothetical protein [Pedobacter sp. UBA5917]|jgi:hypothetical protein|uniref:hypothetical protein n=1 Tax=Pedobacter sp. UBA5917 TaxID=1947061 RepID=UPI0025CFAE33|nr:hypothetical protein [Pedobacter sp. UBA5917]
MKPNVIYTLKVIIVTALATIPLTLLIGMGYIKFLMAVQPNFSFNFNIQLVDIAVFAIITALALLLGLQKMEGKVYHKSRRPFGYLLYSIIVFTVYLWVMGKLQGITIQNFLFSYGPMFFITLLCMRIFPIGKNIQKESVV